MKWPDGKSVAVGLIVPWEYWPNDMGMPGSHQRTAQRPVPKNALYPRNMWAVFDHEYAETYGLKRLLELFDDYRVKATFVANGKRVEVNPELAKEAVARGHDMGSENYIHEYAIMMTKEAERESLEKTIVAFNKVLGAPPSGAIMPGHRPSPNTFPLLHELGFRWTADFQFEDRPFIVRHAGRDIVGMPYANLSDSETYGGGRTPRQILEMLKDEFDVLRREGLRGEPKMMGYAVHPYMCHGFRTRIIEEFLDYVQACPDAWVATRSEITDWVLEQPKEYPVWTLEDVLAMFPETRPLEGS